MAKALAWIAISFLLFPAGSRAQQAAAPSTDTREAQFLTLQMGLFDKQTLAALPDTAGEIARILEDIRTQFPAFNSLRIPLQLTGRTSIIVSLAPALRIKLDSRCGGWSGYAQARIPKLEIPEVDAITEKFDGLYEVTCQGRGMALGAYAVVNFPRQLHIPSLIELYRAAPGITSAATNRALPSVMPVSLKREDGQWHVTLGLGSGDCPAGCIYREYHHFLVAADSTIQYLGPEQQGQINTPTPQESGDEETLPE